MQREKKIFALRQSLGHELISKGDELVFMCPKCNHRKPKLCVNLSSDKFHCWVCSFSGIALVPLLQKGSKEREEYIQEIKDRTPFKEKVPTKKYDDVFLPKEFISFSENRRSLNFNAAMSYLICRGMTYDDVLRWKLGYCEDGEYKNRIIFPSFDEYGALNFFSGRSFYENHMKYKNGNFCKDIIFNDYMIDWDKDVTIVEGPFDAVKVDFNAIALQGSFLSVGSKLFSKIILSGVNVYCAMDSDAYHKQLDIMRNLLSYGSMCYYVDLHDKKDVGEMTKEEFVRAKSNARQVKTDVDVLRLRMEK